MVLASTPVWNLKVGDKILWVEKTSPQSPIFRTIEEVAWGPGRKSRRVSVANSSYSQWFDKSDYVVTAV